jgi:hypothetical protein
MLTNVEKELLYPLAAWSAAGLILAAYEIWAYFTGHTLLSDSVWILVYSKYGPLLPLIVGIFLGHFFWSGEKGS